MKRIRLLINNFHSTSFNYDARETEIIRGVKVLHLWKLSERTQLFSSPSCPKFYDIDINEITVFLFRKHDIFTTRGESSTENTSSIIFSRHMIHDALLYFSFRIKQSSNTIEFRQVITVKWKTWSAEWRKCAVWKMRSVENEECGKWGVWKMRSVENEKCGKWKVWKMKSVENEEYGKWGV